MDYNHCCKPKGTVKIMKLTLIKDINDKKYHWKAKKGETIDTGVILYVEQREVSINGKGIYPYSLFEELVNRE